MLAHSKMEALVMPQIDKGAKRDLLLKMKVYTLLDQEFPQALGDSQFIMVRETPSETQQTTHLRTLLRKAILSELILMMVEEVTHTNNQPKKLSSHLCFLPQGAKRFQALSNQTPSTLSRK